VYVLTRNPAVSFYEHIGATWIRDEPHELRGIPYPASWYGWRRIRDLSMPVRGLL
jgi:hypothetical protein